MTDTTTIDAGADITQPAPDAAQTEQAAASTPPADGQSTQTAPAEQPAAAPESYADFKLPDGVALGALDGDIKAMAKDLGLTQDNAQRVVDTAAKLVQQSMAQQAEQVQAIHKQWAESVRTDSEIGGANLDANLARAKAAMEATATPHLKFLLDTTGLGNHPEVIRHFLKISPAFLPDSSVMPGNKAPGGGKSAAQVLYDNPSS